MTDCCNGELFKPTHQKTAMRKVPEKQSVGLLRGLQNTQSRAKARMDCFRLMRFDWHLGDLGCRSWGLKTRIASRRATD